MASPDKPLQGGGSPLCALPGIAAAAAVTVPLLQQRFNDDDMTTQGKHERTHFEDKSEVITEGEMFNQITTHGKAIMHGKNTRVDSV